MDTLDNFCKSLDILAKAKKVDLNDLMIGLGDNFQILSKIDVLEFKKIFLDYYNTNI